MRTPRRVSFKPQHHHMGATACVSPQLLWSTDREGTSARLPGPTSVLYTTHSPSRVHSTQSSSICCETGDTQVKTQPSLLPRPFRSCTPLRHQNSLIEHTNLGTLLEHVPRGHLRDAARRKCDHVQIQSPHASHSAAQRKPVVVTCRCLCSNRSGNRLTSLRLFCSSGPIGSWTPLATTRPTSGHLPA